MTTIRDLQRKVHQNSRDKGWWPSLDEQTDEGNAGVPDTNEILAKLCLAHSELSEAVEAIRSGDVEMRFETDKQGNDKPEGAVVEMADAVIRVLDLCEALGLDLQWAMIAKMRYNETRSFRHGGKLA